jgi:HK97 family phage major capsid protein
MSRVLAKSLREKRANIAEQANAILALAEKEARSLTSEENTAFDTAHAEIEELRGQIERIEKQESVDRELTASQGARTVENRSGSEQRTDVQEREERQNAAFTEFLRGGAEGVNADNRQALAELRAQSVGTQSAGGYAVAPAFYNVLTEALKDFGGMRDVATVIATETGASMPMPTENDTSNVGAILAENAQVSETDVTFGIVTLGAFKYTSGSVLISLELLQDSAFDLNAFIARKLGERIARIQNAHFSTGTGSGQPTGVIPAAAVGTTGATGQTTSLIYDDLVNLIHSVDPSYRTPGARFMMADGTLKAIKKLKDTQGHPLWQPSLTAGTPDSLLGYGITINQQMAAMAANAKSIAFGDLSKYFIRDVKGITVVRLAERYADFGQVGFLAFARADGNLLDAGTHPVAVYANSAT